MRDLGFKLRNSSLRLLLLLLKVFFLLLGISVASPHPHPTPPQQKDSMQPKNTSLGGTLPNGMSTAVGKQHGERMLEMHLRRGQMPRICTTCPALCVDPSVTADKKGFASA